MKKRDKKLQLSRETILRLQSEDLRNALGGVGDAGGVGDVTSCYEACCEQTAQ